MTTAVLPTQTTVELCQEPVFVIGSPRSGTSAVPWALAHHPELWTSNESDLLWQLFGEGKALALYEAASARPKTWLREHEVTRSEFLQHLGTGINALYSSRSGSRRWIDQTPVNTMMVDVLADMFPGARFLHVLRDGRRVVHSMIHFGAQFAPGADPAALPAWSRGFREAAACWAEFVDRALTFGEQHPARCLEVVNEKLSADPETGFTEIQEFLGVAPRETAAAFFRTSRINSSFEADPWSTGRPPDAEPLHERRPWEAWSREERRIFHDEAGATMVRAGFFRDAELDRWLDE